MRLVVLISGNGSNLQAIIDACQAGRIRGTLVGVLSNRADAYGLQRAADAGIPVQVLANANYADREQYDAALAEALDHWQADIVILAGFMRILTAGLVERYAGRMLNIHPALLPRYPGVNTHQRALAAGDDTHGTSVHFVTAELDGGPVILQAQVPVFPDDEVADLSARVLEQEHRIYPLVINWLCCGRLAWRDHAAWLDGQRLPAAGYASDDT